MKVRPPHPLSKVDALEEYRLLQSSREAAFDEIAVAAAAACTTPYASINLCNNEGLWSKAHCGPDAEMIFADLNQTLCLKVVASNQSLCIPDLSVYADGMTQSISLRYLGFVPISLFRS